jgi:ppGpp synthetase/RelA/SpoT-type nucleotidyltranferase
MEWTIPEYTRTQVDRAGHVIRNPDIADSDWLEAYSAVDNWRSSHAFPLNTIQTGLRGRARIVDPDCLVAQRLKRFWSIWLKLRRFPTMNLSQMQDIGGCRAVVSTVDQVYELHELSRSSKMRHELARCNNYILEPKRSGYRGVHLIYRYESDRKVTYNGLQIEVQLRSKIQHAWATAVETVGTFTRQSLKSSLGSEEWLRFFALMSCVMALKESTPRVPDVPTAERELYRELRASAAHLDVLARLDGFARSLHVIGQGTPGSKYYLLQFDSGTRALKVEAFRASELERANIAYREIEKANAGSSSRDAVLVSVDSLEALRRAYPNYFLDTQVFAEHVAEAIQ